MSSLPRLNGRGSPKTSPLSKKSFRFQGNFENVVRTSLKKKYYVVIFFLMSTIYVVRRLDMPLPW